MRWPASNSSRLVIVSMGSRPSRSTDAKHLVSLKAEFPSRVREAVFHRQALVGGLQQVVHRLQEEMREVQAGEARRVDAFLREHQLQLVTGLDDDLGVGTVPLVSAAIVKPRACSAAVRSASTCSSGSPPVSTTKRCDGSSPQCRAISSASASAVLNLPPPSPSVPTKSVSQKVQTAVARSSSRPVHRLQPAKRQNTAGRPALAPSPCSV